MVLGMKHACETLVYNLLFYDSLCCKAYGKFAVANHELKHHLLHYIQK
jgi:hypothetical protein